MAAPVGNKFAEGLTTSGRPPIYEENEDGCKLLYDRIISYFDYIEGEFHIEKKTITEDGISKTVNIKIWDRLPEPPTVTGLTLYIGFSSKTTLYEYAKKEVFANSIKRALTFVEKNYEKYLFDKNPAGAIFALKNMGWTDTKDITTKGERIDNGNNFFFTSDDFEEED